MTADHRWTVIEARHTARLDASRAQVLAAELDLAFQGEVMGTEFRDVVESVPGVPHRWTQKAGSGPLRQAFASTLISRDPVVVRSVASELHTQTVTTEVDAAPGDDGRIGVTWTFRAELSANDALGRWIQSRARSRSEQKLQRDVDGLMTRWAAAIEARAARGDASSGPARLV